MRKFIFLITLFFSFYSLQAQILFTSDWSSAGLIHAQFTEDTTVNILDFGGDSSGHSNSDSAIIKALKIVEKRKAIIFFPAGKFLFNSTINLKRDSIVLRGKSYQSTQFVFDLMHKEKDCIHLFGAPTTDTSLIKSNADRGTNRIEVFNPGIFKKGDWVQLVCNDSLYMFSTWAYGSLGQVMRIDSIVMDEIFLNSTLRFNYVKKLKPFLRKIQVRNQVGLECFSLIRLDTTINQTSNISMDYVVDSWVKGISSDSCNFSHLSLSHCAHIEISNNYFQQAFAYGGGGQGYGIALQFATSVCKVENNIFNHLRHAVLFQAGANGNVVSYNYMINPFWSETISPSNSAGDIVMHGNFPFANLIEGNINQNMIIDNSHGLNGPYNTYFRNRIELFGLIVTTSTSGDSLQIIQNEITNSNLGYYILQGIGHINLANRIKGKIVPQGSIGLKESSLYLTNLEHPICFDDKNFRWPYIGDPFNYDTESIPAKERYKQSLFALCKCEIISLQKDVSTFSSKQFFPYPNPGNSFLELNMEPNILEISVYNLEKIKVFNSIRPNNTSLELDHLSAGTYILIVRKANQLLYAKWIKL